MPVRTTPSTAKPRILCLHGYHGRGSVLAGQMGPLVDALEPHAELVFMDAPSLAAGDYGWWHAVDAERDPPSDDPGVATVHRHYKGWERTREALVRFVVERGPFAGVFGFSQGAALAGLVVGLPEMHVGFAVMVSGFAAKDPELAKVYSARDRYAIPSLHVLGTTDTIVSNEQTRALAASFADPVVVEHGGGHVIPNDPRILELIRASLQPPRAALDIPLWPNLENSPSMRVEFPTRPDPAGRALVVLRGGAYAAQGTGDGTAAWAARHGMVGIEVAYRTRATGSAYPQPYADATRAMRIVRSRAKDWGINPSQVGIMGYSAGGHLGSLVSTQPDLYVDPADDLASHISARPDFLVLAYPLISFVDGYFPSAYANAADNFFGRPDPDEALRRKFSNELHVAPGHPRVFVWTTEDDALVPANHSRLFASACARAGVPVKLQLFAHGRHGLGLATNDPTDVRTWPDLALAWIKG